jgi:UDPglucose--hexose-1-phosphate uridylyltransferase
VSELRRDVFTRTWVVVAPGRHGIGAVRPGGPPELAGRCPFCPGSEADTEETVLAIGDPWQVRVVGNRYPIVRRDPPPPSHHAAVPASGVHEVVIESRAHDVDLADYDAAHATNVLEAIRARLRVLEAMGRIAAVSVFRNRGRRAGSSQPHPHTQIVALQHVPSTVALRAEIARHDAERGRTLLASAIALERREGTRIVEDAEGVITYCPFASHRAWEARLALTEPCPRFSAIDDARLEVLARRLVDLCRRLRAVLGPHDYNVLLRDPPVGLDEGAFFTVDVLPRTGGDAGFELQSGTPVCTVPPEHSAAALRAGAGGSSPPATSGSITA